MGRERLGAQRAVARGKIARMGLANMLIPRALFGGQRVLALLRDF